MRIKAIPSIIDTFEDDTKMYAVMEIVKGQSMDIYVKEKKIVHIHRCMHNVLEILQYLHKQSIFISRFKATESYG